MNPKTGHLHTIAKGSPLTSASYLTYQPDGKIAVTDENLPGIFNVNPATGAIHQLALSGAPIDGTYGIDTDRRGNLIVANYGNGRIERVNHRTHHVSTITSGPWLSTPYDVAVNRQSGTIFVTDSGGAVDRVSRTGHLSTVASGPPLAAPWGIARGSKGILYITDTGASELFRVNPTTGAVHPVASLPSDSYGVVAATRRILFTTDFFGGAVNRVNVSTGHVAPVTSDLQDPIGITIQP